MDDWNSFLQFAHAVIEGHPAEMMTLVLASFLIALVLKLAQHVVNEPAKSSKYIQELLAITAELEKSKHELADPEEKPKRGRVMLGDDGELLEIMEDEE